MINWFFKGVSINLVHTKQFVPNENNCRCYKKLASRLWPMLFYTIIYFFVYIHSPLLLEKKKRCDCCFPQQIRPQITVQLYIVREYSSVRIVFNAINKRHTLLIVRNASLNPLSFDHYYFTQI